MDEKPSDDSAKNVDDRPFPPDTPHNIINALKHPDPAMRPADPRDAEVVETAPASPIVDSTSGETKEPDDDES